MSVFKRFPLFTAVTAAGLKGCCVDLVVQNQVHDRISWNSIDKRRLAFFTSFGLVYVGAGQYYLFNRLFPAVASSLTAGVTAQTMVMTGLDSLIHIPFFYLPTFYSVREVFYKYKRDNSSFYQLISSGLATWKNNLVQDFTMQATIFIPVQFYNFRYNPPHLRIPFIAAAGVVWVAVLSVVRGKEGS